jgi:peptidoglycan/LPS O-acetylase OafA/YrhL
VSDPNLETGARHAWSLSRNLHYMLHRAPGGLAHVDGLRAFASLWMVSYHTLFYIGLFLPPRFLPHYADLVQHPSLRLFAHGQAGVDIFFGISGFLIAHLLLVEHRDTGKILVRRFYVRRALRLLPAYVVGLLLYCLIVGVNCDTVWANLLYVNNFLPVTRQCMTWSWSLAIEEQFYIVFPAFLILLLRLKRFRLATLAGLLALSVAIRWIIIHAEGFALPIAFNPRLHGDMATFTRYFDAVYCKPYTRYGGLLVGVLVAYLYHRTGFLGWFSRQRFASLVGSGAVVAAFAVLLVPDVYFSPWSPAASALYLSGGRLLFAAAACGVIVLCLSETGAGRVLGRFLGHRVWYPFAQLSYSVYLLHPIVVIACYVGWLRPRTPGPAAVFGYFLLIIALTHVLAALVYLLVERPVMSLRRHPRVLRWEGAPSARPISREDRVDRG